MSVIRHAVAIWLAVSAGRLVLAQVGGEPYRPTPERILQLARDARKLQVSLQLDRDVYFPGEEPIVSVLFHNPTSQVLQIPEPLQGGAGGINLLEAEHDPVTVKRLGSPWRYMRAHPFDWNNLPDDARSRLVQPGETFQIDVSTTDGCLGKSGRWQGWDCTFPESEGEYQIEYTYSSAAKAQFRIVWPRVERWAEARFDKPFQIPDPTLRCPTAGVQEESTFASGSYGYWYWDIRGVMFLLRPRGA
ncbi:MAG: hypothetical protein IT167_08830 [Bryobacterales bacterium]|nr:hypothetical protein [Bryobacterales bacterium]